MNAPHEANEAPLWLHSVATLAVPAMAAMASVGLLIARFVVYGTL